MIGIRVAVSRVSNELAGSRVRVTNRVVFLLNSQAVFQLLKVRQPFDRWTYRKYNCVSTVF